MGLLYCEDGIDTKDRLYMGQKSNSFSFFHKTVISTTGAKAGLLNIETRFTTTRLEAKFKELNPFLFGALNNLHPRFLTEMSHEVTSLVASIFLKNSIKSWVIIDD